MDSPLGLESEDSGSIHSWAPLHDLTLSWAPLHGFTLSWAPLHDLTLSWIWIATFIHRNTISMGHIILGSVWLGDAINLRKTKQELRYIGKYSCKTNKMAEPVKICIKTGTLYYQNDLNTGQSLEYGRHTSFSISDLSAFMNSLYSIKPSPFLSKMSATASNSISEVGNSAEKKVISYHIISYHIISYHIISYHIISYHIISYHIISYHIISYHIISYIITYQKRLYYKLGWCVLHSRKNGDVSCGLWYAETDAMVHYFFLHSTQMKNKDVQFDLAKRNKINSLRAQEVPISG